MEGPNLWENIHILYKLPVPFLGLILDRVRLFAQQDPSRRLPQCDPIHRRPYQELHRPRHDFRGVLGNGSPSPTLHRPIPEPGIIPLCGVVMHIMELGSKAPCVCGWKTPGCLSARRLGFLCLPEASAPSCGVDVSTGHDTPTRQLLGPTRRGFRFIYRC